MSLLATRMLEYRAASPNLSKNTARASRYGAFDTFARGNGEANSIITPEMESAAMSQVGRDLKVPVFDTQSISIGSTRTLTIADDDNDSALYTVSFTTLSWGFTQVPARFINNEIGQQQDFNRKFEKYLYAVGTTVEDLALAALDTNKSQVYNSLLNYTLSVADEVVAAQADKDRLISDLTPLLNANDFYNDIHVVGNPGLQSQMLELSKHSLFNDEDQTISFQGKEFHFTNQLADDVLHEATGYAVPKGNVGLLFRQEAEALLGTQMGDSTRWGINNLPLLNIPVSTYEYEAAVDDSSTHAGTSHLERVRKQFFGWSVEVATIVAYNDDLAANASPIVKFAIAKL